MAVIPIRLMLFLILHVWFIQYVFPMNTYDRRQLIKDVKRSGWSLASNTEGFMNIDCGATEDYHDKDGRYFESDNKYIDTGEVFPISPAYKANWAFFRNLRSFPNGTRNCFVLRPKQSKNVNYLITAFFFYGNYDGKKRVPVFDIYIGVNRWRTINTSQSIFSDVVYLATTDTIDMCLVNINSGTPFISSLQLRPLVTKSLYQPSPGNLLGLVNRFDCGATPVDDFIYRYQDDIYDRIWEHSLPLSPEISTINSSRSVNFSSGYSEQPAAAVLNTAVQARGTDMKYNLEKITNPTSEFSVYLHFAELVQPPQGRRHFTVTINDIIQGPFSSPGYMGTMYVNGSVRGIVQISIEATNDSQFPPILNGLEVFVVVPLLKSPSNSEDVNAMMEIKRTYGITEDSWQGDPCVPANLSWSRVGCNSNNSPRIISLNLSSSGLSGDITASLSNLKSLRVLDLSYNNLTGSIPESLAKLSSLAVLNLAGNKLEGSVPKALLEKSMTGALNFSLHQNPKLCFPDPCKYEINKTIILVVVVVSASIVLVAVVIILLVYFNRWNGKGVNKYTRKSSSYWKTTGSERFSYSDIKRITNELTSFIGEGGFGKVYLGELKGTQVAVKVPSRVPKQCAKEFENEVQLLTGVNHNNVVSLIGYCNDEDGKMALVYEYMANGNLAEHIKADTKKVLTWKERLQISLDAARGLVYLHDHWKPPIIHRDLKTTNILLNDKLLAKIADFGISKHISVEGDRSHITTDPRGTLGYLDPEYQITKQLNTTSDVYSFGVILLELITGQPAVLKEFPHLHITQCIAQKDIGAIIDPRLEASSYDIDSVRKAFETAMACVRMTKIQRPDISWVYSELKDALKIETGSSSKEIAQITEYDSINIIEMNPMDTKNCKMEAPAHTW